MPDEDKTLKGSFVLDLRIWWRQVHTLYSVLGLTALTMLLYLLQSP